MLSNGIAPRAGIAADADRQSTLARFSRRLIGLARVHLGGRLRHKVDPEDVVQSAYKSLLARYGEKVNASDGWDRLWGLLTLITIRKCADRVRYYFAECRDLRREAGPRSVTNGDAWHQVDGREPAPDAAAALAETIAELVAGLPAGERAIVELSLQGCSTQEISRQLGRAERSVRRIREQVRTQLEQRHARESR